MRHRLAAAVLAIVLAGFPAQAQNRLADLSDVVTVDLLPGWQGDGPVRVAALRIRLATGWKTYWRSPGEAGIPPRFDWSGTRNVKSLDVVWPKPVAFTQAGMTSIGYSGEVILPIEIRAKRDNQPVALRLSLEIGVCADVCIPATGELAIDLSGPGAADPRIAAALDARAVTPDQAGVGHVSCSLQPKGRDFRIEARIALPPSGDGPVAIELPDPNLWVTTARVTREGGTLVAVSEILNYGKGPIAIDRSDIRLTVIGATRAVEIQGCPSG